MVLEATVCRKPSAGALRGIPEEEAVGSHRQTAIWLRTMTTTTPPAAPPGCRPSRHPEMRQQQVKTGNSITSNNDNSNSNITSTSTSTNNQETGSRR